MTAQTQSRQQNPTVRNHLREKYRSNAHTQVSHLVVTHPASSEPFSIDSVEELLKF